MIKIGSATNTANGSGEFTEGSSAAGVPPTLIKAGWLNAVQRELVSVVEGADIVLNPDQDDQVLQAIKVFTDKAASETSAGRARLATQAEVNSGVDDTTIVTPKKFLAGIGALIAQATEALKGIAKVATQAQVNSGVDDTTIVTPKKFSAGIAALVIQATESISGIAKVATQAITDSGVDDATVVTPKKLRNGFAASITTNGYVVFPSWLGGLIVQWGSSVTTGGVVVPNFPLAFPNACFWGGMCISSASFLGQFTPSVGNTTLTSIQLLVSTGASVGAGGNIGVRWLAIGK